MYLYSAYVGLNVPTQELLQGLSIYYMGSWSLKVKPTRVLNFVGSDLWVWMACVAGGH